MEESDSPAPGTMTGETSESHVLRSYWLVLLERRWLIFCTFFVIVTLGLFYAYRSKPIFQAVGRMQIDPETAGVLTLRDSLSLGGKDQDYLQTQYRAITSRTLIEAVIQKLKLDQDSRYIEAEDRVEAVSTDFNVEPVRLTRLVLIKANHPDPRRAADMVNTLMNVYLMQNQDRKTSKAFAGYAMLKQEAQLQEQELIASIEDLQKYRVEKGMISLVDDNKQGENVDAAAHQAARRDYDQQSMRTTELQKLVDEANRWKDSGRDISDFYGVNQDRLVNELKGRIAVNESRYAELRATKKDLHPSVQAVLQSLKADKDRLTSEAQRAYDSILSNLQVEKAKELQARAKLDAAERRMTDLNAARTRYDVLNRKKERNEFFYQQILAKMREFNLNTKDTLQNITIDYPAVARSHPVKPNRSLIATTSVVLGLVCALGLAFFVNFLDDSVKSQEDVENYLGVNFLAYIPRIKAADLGERGLHTHLQPTSAASEGFRTLRATVSLARNAGKLQSLTITSTIPSEGKSLFSCNYAIVTAQTGIKTLLVDADMRRPVVQMVFKLQSPAGLAAYLSENVRNLDEIVHTTEVPNLDVVCCGKVPSNPSELLASKRMQQFLKEASQRYERIILDCPPLSAVADPLVVGSITDGVLYVTKFNKVRRDHVRRSVQRIQDAGIRLVGMVVNDIDFEGKDAYYHHYHYHQNRYYQSHYGNRESQEEDAKSNSGSKQAQNASRA